MCRSTNFNTFVTITVKHLFILLAVSATLNCSQHVSQVGIQDIKVCLPFIQLGVTEKQEIFDRLGEPANSYEGGRIVTYTVSDRLKGRQDVISCDRTISEGSGFAVYNLVLVFGTNNVLERHSLVRVR
jgi:hypothetical protein